MAQIDTGDDPDWIHPRRRKDIEQQQTGHKSLIPGEDLADNASGSYADIIAKLEEYIGVPYDKSEVIQIMLAGIVCLDQIKGFERGNEKYLEGLALETVLNLPEFAQAKEAAEAGELIINVKLTDIVDMVGLQEEVKEEINLNLPEFENDFEMQAADLDEENIKRRFINTMIQGAAQSKMYLFETLEDRLTELNESAVILYGMLLSTGNFGYWVTGEMSQVSGGEESVEIDEDGNGVINAKAVVFPLLIHEIVKGLTEWVAMSGLPDHDDIANNVIGNQDTFKHEIYDLMLGDKYWRMLENAVGEENRHLLYNVFVKLVELEAVDESIEDSFKSIIKKIISNPNEGKRIIQNLIRDIENEL